MAQAAQTLASALPVTEEQALTLVKSGFTNLEGLRDADVQDLVDILAVDETKGAQRFTRPSIGRNSCINYGSGLRTLEP